MLRGFFKRTRGTAKTSMRQISLLTLLTLPGLLAGFATAQEYPSRTVKLIVPFAADA